MGDWIDICAVDDLQPESGVCALVGDEQVAIFYWPAEQKVYAVNNFDPFGKANVMSRGMIGDIKGEPMVASPLYKQHFNLQTGQCFEDETVHLKTYPVRIENERVLVQAGVAQ